MFVQIFELLKIFIPFAIEISKKFYLTYFVCLCVHFTSSSFYYGFKVFLSGFTKLPKLCDYVLILIEQKYWSFRTKLCDPKRFLIVNSYITRFCFRSADFQKISYYRLASQFVNPISFNVHYSENNRYWLRDHYRTYIQNIISIYVYRKKFHIRIMLTDAAK